jgi:ribokinase
MMRRVEVAHDRIRSRSMGNVIVTLGASGAWLDTQDFAGHLPAFSVAAIDTVGAGNAFIGALVVRLQEGAPYREAALFANAAAALSVTRPGAQHGLPRRAEVDAWLAQRL